MSAIAALKGYRTQFLYSLHHMLMHPSEYYYYRLEGEEDLDILDGDGHILQAIQVKNLNAQLTLSHLLHDGQTCFVKRLLYRYPDAQPHVVSFGAVSEELTNWKHSPRSVSSKEKSLLQKYKINSAQWQRVKTATVFTQVNEDKLISEILTKLQVITSVEAVHTAENLLYWLQLNAEQQKVISAKDITGKIEAIAQYLSERISVFNQYGLFIKPLHKTDTSLVDAAKLEEEFYYGISARYEHILLNHDVPRPQFLGEIHEAFAQSNTVIIQGASGQGKSTLAYRYVNLYAPGSLCYELLLQQDPVATAQAIHALLSIVKTIHTPVLLLIHVTPGSTEWLKLVREFSHLSSIRFLVTIRQEDWFRAVAGDINFTHRDIELSFNRAEAGIIYHKLHERAPVTHYADFEEAWILLGSQAPLLEFVYSITQGDSLKSKLKQQTIRIAEEDRAAGDDNGLELLRLISLADSFSARVEITKLSGYPGIGLLIEKFEKEYLLTYSADKKYITGLHPVRSSILRGILFDGFVVTGKDHVVKCLQVITGSDSYLFLVNCFYNKIIDPAFLIDTLSGNSSLLWDTYHAVFKSLLWAGIREYIFQNKELIDQCHEKYGDSWILIADVYHGESFDIRHYMETAGFTDEIKTMSAELATRFTPKSGNYKHASALLEKVPLPQYAPTNHEDWEAMGRLLFWLHHLPNNAAQISVVTEQHFTAAFATLPLEALSKLMLGMFHYSENYNQVRLRHASVFIDRMRDQYKIPAIDIGEDIEINYIIDVVADQSTDTMHQRVMRLIDLLRDSFPDRSMYCAQAHGHRLKMMPLMNDETTKHILLENLPLDEWTNLNAGSMWSYEYAKRPKDWTDFHEQLSAWEDAIAKNISRIHKALQSTRTNQNYSALYAQVENAQRFSFHTIKTPQSIHDPLGINARKTHAPSTEGLQNRQEVLSERYKSFYGSYTGFKTDIDNFIRQFGLAVYGRLKRLESPDTLPDFESERLSMINLGYAVEKLDSFIAERNKYFSQFINPVYSNVTRDSLMTLAALWKDFLNNGIVKIPASTPQPGARIPQLKEGFEARMTKAFKKLTGKGLYRLSYYRNKATENKAVVFIDSTSPAFCHIGMQDVYAAIKEAVDNPEYNGLKYLMLRSTYPEFAIALLVDGHLLQKSWYTFPLYVFQETEFAQLEFHHGVPKPIPNCIIDNFSLRSWDEVYPKISEVASLSQTFVNTRIMAEHMHDLSFFAARKLDKKGERIVLDYCDSVVAALKELIVQLHQRIQAVLKEFPFDEEAMQESENEQMFWKAFLEINNNIMPADVETEDDFDEKLGIPVISEWVDRLNECQSNWMVFTILLTDKYIRQFRML